MHKRSRFNSAFVALALLFQLGLLPQVKAQSVPYSYSDLERLVITQNLTTAASLEKLNEIESKLSEARGRALPQLSASYRYSGDGLTFSADDFATRHLLTARLSHDLIKFTGARSQNIRALNAEMAVVEYRLQDAKQKALFEFRQSYIQVLENRLRMATYKELIDIYTDILVIMNVKYENQEELLTEVLLIERELINARGLFGFHESRYRKGKRHLAASFDLTEDQIDWQDVSIRQMPIDELRLVEAAVSNNNEIKAASTKATFEANRVSSLLYHNFILSPYIGLRLSENRFSTLRTGPEFGLRFTFPFDFFGIRRHQTNQNRARSQFWKLRTQKMALDLKAHISERFDRYRLLDTQIKNTEKLLELSKERARIEFSTYQPPRGASRAAPLAQLELEVELKKLQMQNAIHGYERSRIYYELLYISGLSQLEARDSRLAQTQIMQAKRPRALWVWKTSRILRSRDSRMTFVQFCQEHQITKVFLSFNKAISERKDLQIKLADFLTNLHGSGITTSALLGEPLWIYPEKRTNLLDRMKAVMIFNAAHGPFTAIHLDIEPHSLTEWRQDSEDMMGQFAETIKAAKNLLSNAKSQMALEVDIPTFYHRVDEEALEDVLTSADLITVMAYERMDPDKIKRSLQFMSSIGARKQFLVGLNAKEFHELESLENLLRDVTREMADEARFVGFAIHDFRHLRDLVER